MKGLVGLAACLAGTAAAFGAVAQTPSEWAWADARKTLYSVQTPCSAEELAVSEPIPDDTLFKGVSFARDSRVVCVKGRFVVAAGVVAMPVAPGSTSLFDQLSAGASSDKTAESKASFTSIKGQRAYLNRQEEKGIIAQTGLIELDRTNVLMMVAGNYDEAMPIKQQADLIDHFYGSVTR